VTGLLAQAVQEATKEDIRSGYGGLIFMGLFFLLLIVLGIWWLKR
jgi:hypothetical protein